MRSTLPLHDRETQLLREIGGLSDRVRVLRTRSAAANGVQIKALELPSRANWAELRGPPRNAERRSAIDPWWGHLGLSHSDRGSPQIFQPTRGTRVRA